MQRRFLRSRQTRHGPASHYSVLQLPLEVIASMLTQLLCTHATVCTAAAGPVQPHQGARQHGVWCGRSADRHAVTLPDVPGRALGSSDSSSDSTVLIERRTVSGSEVCVLYMQVWKQWTHLCSRRGRIGERPIIYCSGIQHCLVSGEQGVTHKCHSYI